MTSASQSGRHFFEREISGAVSRVIAGWTDIYSNSDDGMKCEGERSWTFASPTSAHEHHRDGCAFLEGDRQKKRRSRYTHWAIWLEQCRHQQMPGTAAAP
jgi:hypothetical protein